jgi:glycosyltransferase involved in cell wall biosynthesis
MRHYGTFLRPALGRPLKLLKRFPEVHGYRIKADLFIVTDDGTGGDEVFARLHRGGARLLFLRNGVERLCSDQRRQSDPPPLQLLTVSRLVREKRVDRAIALAAGLLQAGLEVVLDIVGDGPERKSLEELIEAKGLTRAVRIRGAVAHRDVGQYLGRCHLFLSLYDRSNLGNPLFEALACGRAVLTIANGGTPSVIQNGINGLAVPQGPEMMATLLAEAERVLNDTSVRRALEDGARKYAEEALPSWEERLQTELEVVEGLL